LSEESQFGLGVSLFTKDTAKAQDYAAKVSDGALFINELVKSDPRLPFGGTKKSGFGRELAKDGMMEFINRKVVYIK
jgi:succinate-semialdehyde dehydrogenase/glutarate-semialdehyde dehydrogenase